jgi:uncharacterized RDD family membrane protein YckC
MTDKDLQQKRIVAALIDIAVAIAIGIAFFALAMVVGFAGGAMDGGAATNILARIVSFLGSSASLAYVLGRDIVLHGKSVGKSSQNLRVVRVGGGPITFQESMRRNAIFAIGSALGLVSATLQLVPCLGDAVACLLMPLWILGVFVSLGAAIYEILRITQDPEGVRYGDQLAATRVVRG